MGGSLATGSSEGFEKIQIRLRVPPLVGRGLTQLHQETHHICRCKECFQGFSQEWCRGVKIVASMLFESV